MTEASLNNIHSQEGIIQGDTGAWEMVIGLEIHAQISSNSKLFSGSATTFAGKPNSQVSFIDAAMPGMLPVLNLKCVEQTVRTGIALNAEINLYSVFDRKNYFYADLPQGYQITQLHHPIVGRGEVGVDMPDGSSKTIGITRIHIEQDAGKSIHDQSPSETFIDLNRCGVGLMEIVTDPDMRSSLEVAEFLKKLRSILRYLGTCDGDMEKGSLRCDANVSVRRLGSSQLGTRVEIKNVNSIKNLTKAVNFEAQRQVALLEAGGSIAQETRLFDANNGDTRPMRSKENAYDYRYYPDPDLLPLRLTQDFVDNIKGTMPELPDAKKQRYIQDLGLSVYDASVLVAEKSTSSYFEKVASLADAKMAANWILGELFGRLNAMEQNIESSPVSAERLASLILLLQKGTISGKIAKQVFDIMFTSSDSPEDIVAKHGLQQVSDDTVIHKIVAEVLHNNQDKVAEYRQGKDKLFGFFVGMVMKISEGKANPAMVNEELRKQLSA